MCITHVWSRRAAWKIVFCFLFYQTRRIMARIARVFFFLPCVKAVGTYYRGAHLAVKVYFH